MPSPHRSPARSPRPTVTSALRRASFPPAGRACTKPCAGSASTRAPIGADDAMKLALLARIGAIVIALSLGALEASAEPDEAARSFDEGLGHYRRKAYTRAAEAFYRAHRLAPSGDAAYNAALAWELAGTFDRAATAFALALNAELGAAA